MLSDFHIHSNYSMDGYDTMRDMAQTSAERGIGAICFTDHCDIDNYLTGEFDPRCFDFWQDSLSEFKSLCENPPPELELRLGLELGAPNHRPELAAEISSHKELDFVLGSVHNLRNTADFYGLCYESEEHCATLLYRYLDELTELAESECVDCVAHIGYTRRYMLQAGFDANIEEERYAPQIEVLMKRVIESGKGIEINCSGYRRPGINAPIPGKSILKRYRELGGEIITIGSDAHRVSDAGSGITRGLELLKELGYRYYTVYRQRKPEFIEID